MNYIRSGHRVEAAEQAAMARLRELEADWRMLKRSAREAMTPGRVVGVGLATGFVLGRAGTIEDAGGLGRILGASVAMLNFAASRQAHEAAEVAELAAGESDLAD
ncbi:MAG TPA: hypothetical protein VFG21_03470 [Xanthomonadaceae bacterium]|nr:hypothetical protein [Xanthomonadaceae bacterium]